MKTRNMKLIFSAFAVILVAIVIVVFTYNKVVRTFLVANSDLSITWEVPGDVQITQSTDQKVFTLKRADLQVSFELYKLPENERLETMRATWPLLYGLMAYPGVRDSELANKLSVGDFLGISVFVSDKVDNKKTILFETDNQITSVVIKDNLFIRGFVSSGVMADLDSLIYRVSIK